MGSNNLASQVETQRGDVLGKRVFNKHTLAMSGVILSLGLLLIPFNNCSKSHSDPLTSISSDPTLILNTLRVEGAQVLAQNCSSCHNQDHIDSALTSLDFDYLDQNGYVEPGSPQTSYLYLRIVDGTMPPSSNLAMSAYDFNILRDWIAAEGGNFDTYIGGQPIDTGNGGRAASFNDVRQILQQNCTNCHLAGGTPPRLDVDANTFRNATFNGQRLVIPNNASGSLLYQSLGRMPTGGPLGVNSTAGNVIRSWINGGAQ